jgi:hypothetical protein
VLVSTILAASVAVAPLKTQNVVLLMTDGLRWQEVFGGADRELFDGAKLDDLRAEFWRETPEARREALMPFFWGTLAKQGQVYGNRYEDGTAKVSNGLNFSYPGYSETLCGYVDPAVNSNNPTPNRNVTVLEWVHRQPGFKGKVAAFGAWDVIGPIVNPKRAGLPANAGYEPLTEGKMTPEIRLLNRLKAELPRHPWGGEPYDAITFHTAMQYVKANRPRVLFLSLGETDEWAHANNYREYLISAKRFDAYVKELWETLQSMPQYRGKTTLGITVDHGRGDGAQWTSHGANIKGAESSWIVWMGPDTPARGVVRGRDEVTNAQVASTLARFLGLDYTKAQPRAAAPMRETLRD